MDLNICVVCGNQFEKKYKVCGNCGNPTEAQQKIPKENLPYIGKIQRLLKDVDKSLSQQSSIRTQIIYRKQKIKDLMSVNSNESGDINIQANGKKIKVPESTFRIIIQKDINELFKELEHDFCALEEFNSKFE